MAPGFVILNPGDAWNIRLLKDNYGGYIFGPPTAGGVTSIFGLSMVVSNAMTGGQFLVGTVNPDAAHLRMRSDATVEISTEHSDYFTKNMIAIRAELRCALVVRRPAAFAKGSVTTSP
jgi:HK97 family phage major capsid protein